MKTNINPEKNRKRYTADLFATTKHLSTERWAPTRPEEGGAPMIHIHEEPRTVDPAVRNPAGSYPQAQRADGQPTHRKPPPRLDKPLLILAFGGSGREIATEAKAILLERHGQMPENARILAFDSAADPVTRWDGRHGRVVELERESEFYLLEPVPLAGIKRSRHRHPEIVERLGDSLDKIHRVNIHDGAAQERPQGLLSLMWNAPWVFPLIRQAVRRLVERDRAVDNKIQAQSGIHVAVVGSVCGGQGSGSMLDGAYFVQEALSELGELADRSRVVGMFVLPGAFANVDGPNLLPNAFSFALELDELMQGGGFHASYPGGLRIDSLEAPFNHVYLLDGVDEQGRAWPNREEVCALGGRALCVLFGSEVGMQAIAGAVNKHGVLHGRSPAGFGTYLGAVGQAVIRFPAAQVARRCALRQAQTMIREHYLAPEPEDAPQQELGVMGLDAVRDRLRTSREGAPLAVQLLAPIGLENSQPDEMPNQLRTLVANYQQRRLFGDYFTQMHETAAGLKEEMAASLEDRLAHLLAEARVRKAQAWLHRLQETLQQQHGELLADADELAARLTQAQAALDSADGALDRAVESLFLWRAGKMRAAAKVYLEAANELLQLRLAQRRNELTAEVVHHGLVLSRQRLRQVDALVVRLTQAAERLDVHIRELSRVAASHSEINLADEALVDDLFRLYAGDAAQEARQAVQGEDVLGWARLTPDQLAGALSQAAAHSFTPLAQISVEDVLRRRWDDRSAQQWISRLEGLAAASWNLDRSMLLSGSGLAEFTTLGVPDAAHSIFAGGDITLASTYDPERIVALRTVYGASLDALKPWLLWRRKYEQAVGRTPLHCLPKFQRQDDRSLQHFVLGLIFELIDNAATWFYYRPADELAGRVRLGQGLENALAAFREKSDLQAEVMARITDRIAQEGTAAALERIDRYVAAGGQDDDELTRNLRRAARDYAAELRRNRRAAGEENS